MLTVAKSLTFSTVSLISSQKALLYSLAVGGHSNLKMPQHVLQSMLIGINHIAASKMLKLSKDSFDCDEQRIIFR